MSFESVAEPAVAIVELCTVVISAREPISLARFWAQALDQSPASVSTDRPEVFPVDCGFSLRFVPTTTPKTGQNRIHFDLTTNSTDDMTAHVASLLASGATHVDIGQGREEGHVVLSDPEGNEFCVIDPTNRFLGNCPRLGAVNCDGTAALGHFWSRALGWPLVWDQDEETAIQAPTSIGRVDGASAGPKITWSGPPLMARHGPERMHFHVTTQLLSRSPRSPTKRDSTSASLIALGATRADQNHACDGAVAMYDPDGNPFCITTR